jgi:hypothetical protein
MRRAGFGRDGFRHRPQRLIKAQHQRRTEPPGQRRARHHDQIADRAQAKAREGGSGLAVDTQGGRRQGADGVQRGAGGRDAAAMPGQRMGGPDGIGNARPGTDARATEACLQVVQQRRLAAVKMRRSRQIDHHPVQPIPRDPRRIAAHPPRERRQERPLSRQIGRAGDKIGTQGARIGQGHAAPQTPGTGRPVQAMQMIGIARPMGQRKGPLNGPDPQPAFARQSWKPHGQNATCHANERPMFQMFLFCS